MIRKDSLTRLNPYIRNKKYIVEFAFHVFTKHMIWNDDPILALEILGTYFFGITECNDSKGLADPSQSLHKK